MPTTTQNRRMVVVSKDSKIKPLGYIVWWSVPDVDVSLRALRTAWGLAGLELSMLPKDQRAVNAFKRAVSSLKGVSRDANGNRVETDVRDVVETYEDVVYQVSRVVRDEQERVVEYPKALRVWFSKVTEEIKYTALKGVPPRELLPMMDTIHAAYDQSSKSVTGSKVRTLVRHYIKDQHDEGWRDDKGAIHGVQHGLSGVPVGGSEERRGQVYFVMAKHAEQLEALADCLNSLYKPQGRAYLEFWPMADGASEREMVRRHFVTNIMEEMQKAMANARKVLREEPDAEPRLREIREDVVRHHWKELEQLKRHAAEYFELLEEEQEDVRQHMDVLHRQLRKLGSL